MRTIDADAFCSFLREVSTRQHYETLLTKKDRYPTVADVIEEICCDLDGTSLNGFDNAPTVDTTFREVVAYECGQKSVEERPAEWEYTDGRWGLGDWRCSKCGGYSNKDTHYCPNCGRRMKNGC